MPVGNADGGQWTDGGGGGGSDSFSGDDGNDRLAMSKVPQALEILKPFLKPLLKPKPGLQKIPEFLSKRPGIGKIIGRLDLLSGVLTEKYRRAVITYVQNLLGGTFLQFLPVR